MVSGQTARSIGGPGLSACCDCKRAPGGAEFGRARLWPFDLEKHRMSSMAAILLSAVALYVAAGIATGLAFVLFGVTQVFPHPVSVTPGARIVLLPGAALLWPLVLRRWLKSRSHR